MKKNLLFSAVFLIALLTAAGCAKKKADIPEAAISVRTQQAQERTFQDVIATQGVIEAVEHAVLSTKNPGQLESLTVKEGDSVKQGQILFTSDRINMENRLRLALETLKMAEERLTTRRADMSLTDLSFEKAEKDFNRNKTLFDAHAISSDKFESYDLSFRKAVLTQNQAKAAMATAMAEISFAQTGVKIAQKHLDDAFVKAPYDGIITAKMKNENEYCVVSTPVLKIENPARGKRITAVANGQYFPSVTVGKTKIEVSFAGKVLCTVPVSILANAIDPVSRTFEVKADLPKDISIPSGTLCDVRIIMNERRSPSLPEEALLFRPNGTFAVFEAQNGIAKDFPVVPGITQNGFTEIRNADAVKGKDIIVSGQYFLSDGSKIHVLKD